MAPPSSSDARAVEVHMQGVSFSVKKVQLEVELAKILHHAPYARFSNVLGPVNFYVYLFKDKHQGNRPHCGSGTLTLLAEVARLFLEEYGDVPRSDGSAPTKELHIGGRRIKFSPSRLKPRPEVVDRLVRFPYVNPAVSAEKEATTAIFESTNIRIGTLMFGHLGRDMVYSPEFEAGIQGTLEVNEERREFRLAFNYQYDPLCLSIRFGKVIYASVYFELSAQAPGIIFFHLSEPPTLESASKAPRQRLTHFPMPGHKRVAPFTSLFIRLSCPDANDLALFKRLAKAANLRNIYDTELHIERGNLFSDNILGQLQEKIAGIRWSVGFQIEALLRNLCFNAKELLELFPVIRGLIDKKGRTHTTNFLRYFGPKAHYWNFYAPDTSQSVTEFFTKEHSNYLKSIARPLGLKIGDDNTFEALHVFVTPTSIRLEGPYPEVSNRIMRSFAPKHHESFLRVTFVDEGKMQLRHDRELDTTEFTRERVGTILREGIVVCGRHFKFLAYSQSALKEHSVWFVRDFVTGSTVISAASIIRSIGRFDNLQFDPHLMRCPARYAARISQAFTATSSTTVEVEEIIHLDDIEAQNGKYQFTDGCGTMSLELASDIWSQLSSSRRKRRAQQVPRAYQVRFQGCKGMLSVDYKLKGHVLCIRPSMIKFEAPHTRVVEIARAFDRPGVYYLNRPLIMLLEGLGIKYEVFKKYQDRAVKAAQAATESFKQFASLLEIHGLGTAYKIPSILLSLDQLEIPNKLDGFYRKMLDYAVHHILRTLKTKARIPIPHGVTVVGVADVHKFLKPKEIFVCTRALDSSKLEFLEGDVLISRSPTIHPGDVQVVRAIGKPPLGSPFAREPLPNTVVFSVLGDRPLPSCLGGGDLDGDTYNILPLSKLPQFAPRRPAEYAPAKKRLLEGRNATLEDVGDFVVDFINSDTLGIIAINWLLIADQTADKPNQGIMHPDCLRLADLHSAAVDFPKTGMPVPVMDIPKPPSKSMPDWHAGEIKVSSKEYYPSQTAIGKLYRAINLREFPSEMSSMQRRIIKAGHMPAPDVHELEETLEDLRLGHQHPLVSALRYHLARFINVNAHGPDDFREDVAQIFSRYCSELQGLCVNHTLSHAKEALLSEEECIIGTIIAKTSQPRKRQDLMAALREKTDLLVRGVKEELAGDEDVPWEDALLRAWLAFQLAMAKGKDFGAQSFLWLSLGAIFEATKELEEESRMSQRRRY